MLTKEKIKLLLDVLLSSRDDKGFLLNTSLESYCELLGVTRNLTRALSQNNLYEGRSKQKKRILFSEVTEELVDIVYNTHFYKSAKIMEEPQESISIEEKLDEMSDLIKTMAGQINFIYNELVHIKK